MTDGERLEQIVETAVTRGDAPGVVAAVGRGDETYVAAAGMMAVGGPPMRPGTLFRIASITKPVTAAVVLSLAEDGLLGADGAGGPAAAGTGGPPGAAPPGRGTAHRHHQGRTGRDNTRSAGCCCAAAVRC